MATPSPQGEGFNGSILLERYIRWQHKTIHRIGITVINKINIFQIINFKIVNLKITRSNYSTRKQVPSQGFLL